MCCVWSFVLPSHGRSARKSLTAFVCIIITVSVLLYCTYEVYSARESPHVGHNGGGRVVVKTTTNTPDYQAAVRAYSLRNVVLLLVHLFLVRTSTSLGFSGGKLSSSKISETDTQVSMPLHGPPPGLTGVLLYRTCPAKSKLKELYDSRAGCGDTLSWYHS